MPITNRDDYKDYLTADLTAAGLRMWRWHYRFRHDVLYFIRLLRKAEYLTNCTAGNLSSLHLKIVKWRLKKHGRYLGLEIPTNVFGKGLVVVHPCGIVVSRKARIGMNCRIHAGVNIGEHRGCAPRLGNSVYIGPGAKIVGGVTIGDSAVIGANAVVVKDVPPGITVGGVPARFLANRDSSYLITQAER